MEHPPPPFTRGIGFATAKKNYAAAKYFFAGTYGEKQFDLFEKELILFMVSGFFQVDVPEIFRFALDDNKRARGRKIFGVRVKQGWQKSCHPIYPVSQRVKSR